MKKGRKCQQNSQHLNLKVQKFAKRSLSLVSVCANFAWGLDIDGIITQDINKQSLVNKHQVNVAELHWVLELLKILGILLFQFIIAAQNKHFAQFIAV